MGNGIFMFGFRAEIKRIIVVYYMLFSRSRIEIETNAKKDTASTKYL